MKWPIPQLPKSLFSSWPCGVARKGPPAFMPNSSSADRYRGVDRRTPAPVPESLNTALVAMLLFGAWLGVVALNQLVASRFVSTLGHADVLAGSLAILGAVAMFIRWRID